MVTNTWQNRSDLLSDPVQFVTASNEDIQELQNYENNLPAGRLTGEEARKIYEDVLKEQHREHEIISHSETSNCEIIEKKYTPKKPKKVTANKKHKVSQRLDTPAFTPDVVDLFRAAQNNDITMVEQCIETYNMDINTTDEYSWTSLMIAAYEGHKDIVLYLLRKGAHWADMVDGSGYDARDLCCIGGHPELASMFTNTDKYIKRWKMKKCEEEISRHIKRERIWCEICKIHFYASQRTKGPDPHYTSTLHLINDKERSQPSSSHYYISGANKGYQLMQRVGWDGQSGLGPKRDGHKYPVKTILKRDRLGFGAESTKQKARVTHFAAHDECAVKRKRMSCNGDSDKFLEDNREISSKTKRKRKVTKKERKEKQKEIDFRRSFY